MPVFKKTKSSNKAGKINSDIKKTTAEQVTENSEEFSIPICSAEDETESIKNIPIGGSLLKNIDESDSKIISKPAFKGRLLSLFQRDSDTKK